MMIEEIKTQLGQLRLTGMARNFEAQLNNSVYRDLSFEERIKLMVDEELLCRSNNRITRLLKNAKLREQACLEDIVYKTGRGLDKSQIASLALCHWVSQGVALIITGAAGTGKTWLACGFGHQVCRNGLPVQFHRLPLLLEDIGIAHGDGSFRKRLDQLSRVDLLILDDFGIGALTPLGRSDLLEVLENRYGRRATIITSQLPVTRWHDYLSDGNPTIADAILDRLVSGSERIELKGESMRLHRNPVS